MLQDKLHMEGLGLLNIVPGTRIDSRKHPVPPIPGREEGGSKQNEKGKHIPCGKEAHFLLVLWQMILHPSLPSQFSLSHPIFNKPQAKPNLPRCSSTR